MGFVKSQILLCLNTKAYIAVKKDFYDYLQ